MYSQIFVVILLLCSGYCRHMPHFNDLDEEDQQLYRAAYDAPPYNHEEYEEVDIDSAKLNLLKDALWAIKVKLNEMKAFDKALVANLLSTKLKLKELLENHMRPTKKHIQKVEINKKNKPQYYQPSYPQYDQQYAVPQYPQYAVPQHAHEHDPYYGI